MKKLRDKNILITLLNVLLILYIIKICKITGFCFTILNLICPLFFGYCFAWIIRPIIEKLKKYNINSTISTLIIYILISGIITILIVILIPKILHEAKNLMPVLNNYINKHNFLIKTKKFIITNNIFAKMFSNINNSFKNVFSIFSTFFYSIIISFLISANNIKISNKFFKHIPKKIINKVSKNLRIYVKGTFLDMLILFVLSSICFLILKLPGAFVLSLLISITNIIPYIGPYIGGIPAVIIALSISFKTGAITLIVIVILQIIESSIFQPLIMSKSLKINPLLIVIGVIIFSHFFGIIGMIISTPIVSIIKIVYDYYKKNKPKWFIKVLDKL